jgi:hypothetical protein
MKNPILKECAMIVPAILALLMLSETYFGVDEASSRFDDSLFASATYARPLEGTGARAERNFAQDVTPARRVNEIFGQFASPGTRRGNGLI